MENLESLWGFLVHLPKYQIIILCSVAYLFCGGLIILACAKSGYINDVMAEHWDFGNDDSGKIRGMVNIIFWSWPFFVVISMIRLNFWIIFRLILLPGLIYKKLKDRALWQKEERERIEALRKSEKNREVSTKEDLVRILNDEIRDKHEYNRIKMGNCEICGANDTIYYTNDQKLKLVPGFYCSNCLKKYIAEDV